ncbi:MAG: hypothetical protein ACI85F_001329 [Bacteroidia bacterium]|jgi:hypothetical protein
MKLKHQSNIDLIPDCPLVNEDGEMELFRCVENPISEQSFIPQAVLLKPKYQNLCQAWGLSTSKSHKHASQLLKNLSKNKRVQYAQVAKMQVTNDHGIKYSGKNREHYTFFPNEEIRLVESFTILESNGN